MIVIPHALQMKKIDFHSLKAIQTLITFLVWLAAAVVMSACSTHTKTAATPAPFQQKALRETVVEAPLETAAEKQKEVTSIKNISVQPPVVHSVHQKKHHFFALMKPIVVAENKHISQQRQQIIQLKGKKQLDDQDMAALKALSTAYGITMASVPNDAFWNKLLNRVNIVPLELALVQAANESAWGTSRFARDGNNYFGQWCYKKGCGIVPSKRDSGAAHEVRRFKDATGSVRAYMKNINTSHAYVYLRKIRSSLQKRHLPIRAELLANGLKHYSERGRDYVKTIRSMIRSNRTLIAQADPIRLVQGDAR